MIRVYCPLAASDVEAIVSEGVTARGAVAVTPAVRALAPDGDAEVHEHLATQLAAAACVGRIVVAALELEPGRVREVDAADVPGLVEVEGPVTRGDLVCFLVGDVDATVTDDAEVELSWYDAGEHAQVAALMAG